MSRWENKYVIGLTGNIAVGKSVVRQMLQHLGAYTIDADGLSHQAMSPGAPAYKPTVETFGRFILDPDGKVNRTRLGAIAFALPEALTALEAIIHPAVRQAINALITRATQKVIVVEAIKLLEGDLASMVDAVWVVDASPESQLRRLMEKRKMSVDDARKRIGVQQPQAEKLKRANVIIMNDGSVEETWRQVQSAWDEAQRVAAPPAVKPLGVTSGMPLPQRPQPQPAKPATGRLGQPEAPTGRPVPARPATGQGPAAAGLPSTGRLGQLAPAAASAAPSPAVERNPQILIRRGMPGNAEIIANFISKVSPRQVGRMDIMLAFGQKSFLLSYGAGDALTGVVGWQVENLITRVDEFYVAPDVAKGEVFSELIGAVEDASKELQSEVSFIVLPRSIGSEVGPVLVRRGYQPLKLEEIRFPAWREAAQDMLATSDADVLIKQLRADRVMKPI